jgi:hypothetical protein
MTDKKYIKGSAKEINWQYWTFLNVSLKFDDLAQYVNDKWYVNMTISPRKTTWTYGDTHSITHNDYKPKPKDWVEKAQKEQDEIDISSIPF